MTKMIMGNGSTVVNPPLTRHVVKYQYQYVFIQHLCAGYLNFIIR